MYECVGSKGGNKEITGKGYGKFEKINNRSKIEKKMDKFFE